MTGSYEDMVAAVKTRIAELEGGVESSCNIESSIDLECCGDNCVYEDTAGWFGDVGEVWDMDKLMRFYDDHKMTDPVIVNYPTFDAWLRDTVDSGYLKPVNCSTNICSSYDEDTEIDNIVGWLQEHETAYNDFNLYFEGQSDELTLDSLISWIADHKQLCVDFCARFPELAEEYELNCNKDQTFNASCAVCGSDNNEYVDTFCWKINDAIIGSNIDVDDVECHFDGSKFLLTLNLEDGSGEDFEIPLGDLTGSVDLIDDDLDYVVGEIEAALG